MAATALRRSPLRVGVMLVGGRTYGHLWPHAVALAAGDYTCSLVARAKGLVEGRVVTLDQATCRDGWPLPGTLQWRLHVARAACKGGCLQQSRKGQPPTVRTVACMGDRL
ncbi:hypothetical protein BHE74_00051914 [Ensete ventricosum]|nr:hypothetical protein BHE74_00051914 [Ensete ventricosum]